MNKIAIWILIIIPINSFAFSVDSTGMSKPTDTVKYWTFNSLTLVSVAQNAFVNWSTGGESSLTGKVGVDYNLKYKKDKFTFDHSASLLYGMVGYIDRRTEKTNDKLNLSIAFSHQASKKWSLTNLITLKSQFGDGYKYPDDSTLISAFFAPAYITVSFGFNYRPSNKFQIFLSPLSGKMTFVINNDLANKGAFGVKKAVVDTAGNIITPGRHFLGEIGVNIVTSYNAEIMENIVLSSALTLHNNYLDFDVRNRWNIDVDFDTKMVFSINNIFATVLYLHLKYDHNTTFPNYETVDGVEVEVSQSPRLQINESFGLGVTYQIK